MTATLTLDLYEAILGEMVDLGEANIDEVFYLDYSGRSMYETKCVGVTGSPRTLVRFVTALASLAARDEEDALTLLEAVNEGPREDNMGRAAIYYWPGVVASDEVIAEKLLGGDE